MYWKGKGSSLAGLQLNCRWSNDWKLGRSQLCTCSPAPSGGRKVCCLRKRDRQVPLHQNRLQALAWPVAWELSSQGWQAKSEHCLST